ncbi:MAG TPA: HAMP domain-containing sensor histidine kinase, partial [Longimicrobiaceae bacterium]|nr:HAMP domain-containing sensor histidine kinase [Longimicrobiaceae bacterium]
MNSHRASSDPTASPEADEIARLAGELLHDLNDALAAHAALIELARLEAQRGTTAGTMERLEDSIRHLQSMVRDLFDEIRPGHASPEIEFDPCAEAQAAFERWRLTAPALRLSFQCEVPSELAVRGRASFFTRVLTNLLRNSAQHARAFVAARIEVHTEDGQRWLHLLVEDDGPGIPLELRERIFEPYVRGSERGTGLGLSMTRWGVRRLGGSVELAPGSRLGGARFLVRVPVFARTVLEPTVSPSVDASLAGLRIAYVDDYVALAQGFARLAEREGAEWIH